MTTDRTTTETSWNVKTEGNFVLNAVIGAVVSVLLSFIPFSTVLGGGVAGYLQGGDETTGAKVGAVSGILAALPVLAVVSLLSLFVIAGPGPRSSVMLLFMAGFALVFAALYVVGLSALGGWAGARLGVHRQADSEVDEPTSQVDQPPRHEA